VLTPDFAPGLNISFDYYDIKLNGAITALSSTAVASLCNAGNAFYCSVFTFGTTGAPTALNLGVQNLASVQIQGVDGAVSYRFPLDHFSDRYAGTVDLSLSGTYTDHVLVDTGTRNVTDRAGENSSLNTYATPRTRLNGSVSYSLEGFTGTVQASFISAGTIDNTYNTTAANSSNLNHVGSYTYYNLYLSKDLTDRVELFGSMRNALNTEPPALPNPALYSATNGVYYDTIGRYVTVGVRMTF
jgi:outer membrane receptor protein involved in Fe transport